MEGVAPDTYTAAMATLLHPLIVLHAGQRKRCHTCEHYSKEGYCYQYKMTPPKEFAESIGECKYWIQEIPFYD